MNNLYAFNLVKNRKLMEQYTFENHNEIDNDNIRIYINMIVSLSKFSDCMLNVHFPMKFAS